MGSILLTEATWLLGSKQMVTVLRYDDHGNPIDTFTQFTSQPGYCFGLATDDGFTVFIADFYGNIWVVLNGLPTTNPIQLLSPGVGGLGAPIVAGSLAVASTGNSRNLCIAGADSVIRSYALTYESVTVPLAATPNGLAGNPDDATFLNLANAGIDGPLGGIEFGPDGNLYVSAGSSIYVYALSGNQIRNFGTNGNNGVIRFGPDGLLYLLVYGGGNLSSIQRFDPQLGIPFGIDGPANSLVVPYGTPQLIGSSDFRVVAVPPGGIQAFVTSWFQASGGGVGNEDVSGGGIVTFDMGTGNFIANFVPNNSGGANQPYALLRAQTIVPGIDLTSGTYQITCADFAVDDDGNQYISTIGGSVGEAVWKLPVQQAIAGMVSGNLSFYTLADGMQATVLIGTSASGYQYLTTSPDGTTANNLDTIAQTQTCM